MGVDKAYLGVLQSEVGESSLRSGISLRQVFVDLIDPLRDVRVCGIEEVRSWKRGRCTSNVVSKGTM